MNPRVPPQNLTLKRAYARPSTEDGIRILVDRLWPRGISKSEAALDRWMKEIAPSADLRKWFGHDPDRWREFQIRYTEELRRNVELVTQLRDLAQNGRVTLIYSAHDEAHNDAVVLRDMLLSG
jgi:uncharacterized protein YeaO (DUF488 family)